MREGLEAILNYVNVIEDAEDPTEDITRVNIMSINLGLDSYLEVVMHQSEYAWYIRDSQGNTYETNRTVTQEVNKKVYLFIFNKVSECELF